MHEIDGNQGKELDNAHHYYIRLSISAHYWHIVTEQTVNDLDAPRDVNHAHVHGHLSWFQMQVGLEQVLTGQYSHGPQAVVDVLRAEEYYEWLVIFSHQHFDEIVVRDARCSLILW